LLGLGRCLVTTSHTEEAVDALADAHDIFERLGATSELREIGRLLESAAPDVPRSTERTL
jgi:hypothetical protein